jgi:hypothetical protein
MIGRPQLSLMKTQHGVQLNVPKAGLWVFHMSAYSLQLVVGSDHKSYACNEVTPTLLPSASCSLNHPVSAPAQPFRIYRYMLSISMDYFIAGSTSH